ncbi:raqprd family integrative conjugative element protein [Klebsiella variicola]|uniref:integrative conjugative element protein, RAQPRD family n=1 Tax=Klebsiella variicola TaxID=244366 RepID=UPI001C97AA73|nr:RAQPRD family integrative conjugative element protein [Klebsiella variicola]MBY5172968.1 raqprd family integrative conjugative element protein [Klebsiella variicola]
MPSFRHAILIAVACTITAPVAATEHSQLAQALQQIDLLQDTLERARAEAAQQQGQRYFFDYTAASRDLSTLRGGLQRYLSPARAQPRIPDDFSGHYTRESTR